MCLSLGAPWSDHAVLQRGKPVPVWGQAAPGAAVSVSFAGHRVTGQADGQGRWQLILPELAASSAGQTLVVTATMAGQAEERFTLHDLLVGEVWLCSGQSNMAWSVAQSADACQEIAAADHPQIRLLKVPQRVASEPMAYLDDAVSWQPCSPQSIADFSAVGYYFGRHLQQQLGVPVGLIHCAWGGTAAEAWVHREGLLSHPATAGIVQQFEADLAQLPERQAAWRQAEDALIAQTRDTENLGFAQGWAGDREPALPRGTWQTMDLPQMWQAHGLDFSGVLWFRREVQVPAAWAGKSLQLSIGAADKSEVTYWGGEQVGSLTMADAPDAWCTNRVYTVPGHLVKAGRNVIAVRVHSDRHAGGLHGPAAMMFLACPERPQEAALPLTGPWRYAVETSFGKVMVPRAPLAPEDPNAPSRLYNGMWHPLIPLALRGVIWYQGESNATRATQYRDLFAVLIADLRRRWGDPALAFHFVQLANYQTRSDRPRDSDWARLREAQALALRLPHAGMAVAIDIGEANDIHPRNKQEVGRRLALGALHQTYGRQEVVPCGPLLRQATVLPEEAAILLAFDVAESGLEVRGERLLGFAIAGADRHFVWAEARIEGTGVRVSSAQVPQPVFVRYGWDDNPACNLYNTAGLPASPFRTDTD